MDGNGIDLTELAALLAAASNDERGALDRLIRVCTPFVECKARQYAWQNTDPEDIVQDVWIQLMRHLARIREPLALLGWLHVVTRRMANRHGHRNKRLVMSELDTMLASTPSPEDDLIERREREHVTTGVRQALGRLDDDSRTIVRLFNDESGQLAYRDVSKIVRRPMGSIGPTRRRILDRLGHDPAVRQLRSWSAAG